VAAVARAPAVVLSMSKTTAAAVVVALLEVVRLVVPVPFPPEPGRYV
jgi:hypothetical protein